MITIKRTDLATLTDEFAAGDKKFEIELDLTDWLNVLGGLETQICEASNAGLPAIQIALMVTPAVMIYNAVQNEYYLQGRMKACEVMDKKFEMIGGAAGYISREVRRKGRKLTAVIMEFCNLVEESAEEIRQEKAAEAVNGKKAGRHEPRTDLS
jgi:hypothetical protein